MRCSEKTYDEHVYYLQEIIKLKLWFVWNWLRGHNESFSHVFRYRVDIYRKTDLNREGMTTQNLHFETQEWQRLEHDVAEIYQVHKQDSTPFFFEKEAFRRVWPLVHARANRDFVEKPYVFDYQCGSLRYTQPTSKHPTCVEIHMANALRPKSFLTDRQHMVECLMRVMSQSQDEYGADSMESFSWLNCHPKWLEYLPEEWSQRLEEKREDIEWNLAFWGQFITAKATFHQRNAQQFRATGWLAGSPVSLPYPPRRSWCYFSEVDKHLRAMFPSEVAGYSSRI